MNQLNLTPFDSVLIANRGEIARRVIASAKRNGLRTIAVFSDADEDAVHVAEADEAVRLAGNTSTETYLNAPAIIAAAKASGAQAIHPGYGFLSENAGFARLVVDNNLIWIGPTADAIDAMGSKTAAKRIMKKAGVPLLQNIDWETIGARDLPILVKAAAGGGGRGMRVVDQLEDIADEIDAAKREALTTFGDDTIYCETYVGTGRHIEVQLIADNYGAIWTVGERECSIQRRHQKVIEEAPSPLVERLPELREKLFDAARKAAQSIGYTGAGTVEFLADNDGNFYFLEVNTRLQVEHPVTEATTGLDLVQLQFEVAAGKPLPTADPPVSHGYAIEARICAEDPAKNYRPSSGDVYRFHFPGISSEFSGPTAPGVRLDSALTEAGGEISVYYDSMLAKAISYAHTREEAAGRLAGVLSRAQLHGVATNRDLLVRVLKDRNFLSGDISTAFLSEEKRPQFAAPLTSDKSQRLSARAASAALDDLARKKSPLHLAPTNYRNVGTMVVSRTFTMLGSEEEIPISYRRIDNAKQSEANVTEDEPSDIAQSDTGLSDTGLSDTGLSNAEAVVTQIYWVADCKAVVTLQLEQIFRRFLVQIIESGDDSKEIFVDSSLGAVSLRLQPRFVDPADVMSAGALTAPMPGTITRVAASPGTRVEAQQPLIWLEAMKMEHTIHANASGILTAVNVSVGQQVGGSDVLVVIEAEEEAMSAS